MGLRHNYPAKPPANNKNPLFCCPFSTYSADRLLPPQRNQKVLDVGLQLMGQLLVPLEGRFKLRSEWKSVVISAPMALKDLVVPCCF